MEREKGMQNHSLFPPVSPHLHKECYRASFFFSTLIWGFLIELFVTCPKKSGETLGYFHMHFQAFYTWDPVRDYQPNTCWTPEVGWCYLARYKGSLCLGHWFIEVSHTKGSLYNPDLSIIRKMPKSLLQSSI